MINIKNFKGKINFPRSRFSLRGISNSFRNLSHQFDVPNITVSTSSLGQEFTSSILGVNNLSHGFEATVSPPEPSVPARFRLDASNLGSITSPNGNVSTWTSIGNFTSNAAQGSASLQGVHSGTGSNAQVNFDGINDLYQTTSNIISAGQTSWHIIAVITADTVPLYTGLNYDGGTVIGASLRWALRVVSVSGTPRIQALAYNGVVPVEIRSTASFSLGVKTILEVKTDGSNLSVAINGGAFESVACVQEALPANLVTYLGHYVAYFDGKMHEVRTYDGALAAGDRTELINWLTYFWGVV